MKRHRRKKADSAGLYNERRQVQNHGGFRLERAGYLQQRWIDAWNRNRRRTDIHFDHRPVQERSWLRSQGVQQGSYRLYHGKHRCVQRCTDRKHQRIHLRQLQNHRKRGLSNGENHRNENGYLPSFYWDGFRLRAVYRHVHRKQQG